jgi:hypothetical protein
LSHVNGGLALYDLTRTPKRRDFFEQDRIHISIEYMYIKSKTH